ncbi:glycosyltransferase family 2 protein [Empedobacter falsenii]
MITIFTPTYNRAYILPQLFESLLYQTNKNFEWLIVDDGSTDDTKELIEQFILKADFKISYLYQNNQGKHIAINTALDHIATKYFVTVDSDDIVLLNGIDLITRNLCHIDENEQIICLAFPHKQKSRDNYQVNKEIPYTTIVSTPYEMLSKYGIFGEFSLVFLHQVHQKYKYPQFENEKFIKESVVYNRIFQIFKLIYFNFSIVESEYLNDGLTSNFRNLLYNNPKGAALSHLEKTNTTSYNLVDRLNEMESYWDYESVFNKSFFNKLMKVKSTRLKFLFLKNRILKIFSKYIK